MRVTLDWDSEAIRNIHEEDALARVGIAPGDQQTLNTDDARPAELWQSSGGEGYHFIEFGTDLSIGDTSVRERLGDDRLRISLDTDRLREGSPFVQVLYHAKEITTRDRPPFDTDKRAIRLESFNVDRGAAEYVDGGRFAYEAAFGDVFNRRDHDNRARFMREIRGEFDRFERGNRTLYAPTGTDATKRGYELASGRRSPYPSERAALLGLLYDGLDADEPDPGDLLDRLAETERFGNRTAAFRAVRERMLDAARNRDYQPATGTDATKRASDIARGKRSASPAERVAIFETAANAGLIGSETEIDRKPTRTTLHEFIGLKDLGDYDGDGFEYEEDESEDYECNIRVGWFGPPDLAPLGERTEDIPDKMALKAVLDVVTRKVQDIMAPGPMSESPRLKRGISMEERRPIDADEMGALRRVLSGSPNSLPEGMRDPFGSVVWEAIVHEEGYSGVEWVARGLVDPADAKDMGDRLADRGRPSQAFATTIVRDSNGWWR